MLGNAFICEIFFVRLYFSFLGCKLLIRTCMNSSMVLQSLLVSWQMQCARHNLICLKVFFLNNFFFDWKTQKFKSNKFYGSAGMAKWANSRHCWLQISTKFLSKWLIFRQDSTLLINLFFSKLVDSQQKSVYLRISCCMIYGSTLWN